MSDELRMATVPFFVQYTVVPCSPLNNLNNKKRIPSYGM